MLNLRIYLHLCAILVFPVWEGAYAQKVAGTNYSTANGLISDNCFDLIEDTTGKIWLATDLGISSFDGRHFHDLSPKQGLPDATVTRLYCDKINRIWFFTNKGHYGYVQNDSVFLMNGSLYEKHDQRDFFSAESFYMDEKNRLWVGLMSAGRYYCISPPYTKQYLKAYSANGFNVIKAGENTGACIYSTNIGVIDSTGKSELSFIDFSMDERKTVTRIIEHKSRGYWNKMIQIKSGTLFVSMYTSLMAIDKNSQKLFIRFGHQITGLYTDYKGRLWVCVDSEGAYCFDDPDNNTKYLYHVYDGVNITSVCSMKSGAFWFATADAGIKYHVNLGIGQISTADHLEEQPIIKSLITKEHNVFQVKNGALKGYDKKMQQLFDVPTYAFNLYHKKGKIFYNSKPPHVGSIFDMRKKSTLMILSQKGAKPSSLGYLHDDDGNLIAFGYNEAATIDTNSGIVDSLILQTNTRINDMISAGNEKFYVSGLDGIYSFEKGVSIQLEHHEQIYKGNTGNLFIDKTKKLWAVSNTDGLLVFDKNRIIKKISEEQGLNKSNLRGAFYGGKDLFWIINENFVSSVNIHSFKLTQYSYLTGIAGSKINSLYEFNDTLWLNLNKGVLIVPLAALEEIKNHLNIYLSAEGFENFSDKKNINGQRLTHSVSTVRFRFPAVFFEDAAHLSFRYRLNGQDENWHETESDEVSYNNLAPGKYVFEVYAIHKNLETKSSICRVSFEIEKPFYDSAWFYLICVALTGFLIYSGLKWRIKTIKKSQEKKMRLQVELAQLEAKFLRAQMNPHFLFNSITSIQHFILKEDTERAHSYLGKFALLMRRILENSKNEEVSLEEELEFITLYLQLEQMRCDDKFSYRINITALIPHSDILLPSMVLQPIVENAVIHGILPLRERKGEIIIDIAINAHELICTITDNGVGRAAAEKNKKRKSEFHLQIAMSLIQERMKLIDTTKRANAGISTQDLTDEQGNACGTKVKMIFPLRRKSV